MASPMTADEALKSVYVVIQRMKHSSRIADFSSNQVLRSLRREIRRMRIAIRVPTPRPNVTFNTDVFSNWGADRAISEHAATQTTPDDPNEQEADENQDDAMGAPENATADEDGHRNAQQDGPVPQDTPMGTPPDAKMIADLEAITVECLAFGMKEREKEVTTKAAASTQNITQGGDKIQNVQLDGAMARDIRMQTSPDDVKVPEAGKRKRNPPEPENETPLSLKEKVETLGRIGTKAYHGPSDAKGVESEQPGGAVPEDTAMTTSSEVSHKSDPDLSVEDERRQLKEEVESLDRQLRLSKIEVRVWRGSCLRNKEARKQDQIEHEEEGRNLDAVVAKMQDYVESMEIEKLTMTKEMRTLKAEMETLKMRAETLEQYFIYILDKGVLKNVPYGPGQIP
ncbi:hypothetical protein M501DRAFT_1014961 [Patellaria atrata CBS 101060]|uniref:Uncharacterized protein n=1 Tax=Patellaria atrata CBS 101060 TaxID=1346257 RepID=A0A9P4VTI8_9PEZI|nr:hypothetical protein M501DRAFT_1014961 [Patellaria atrata CBS 101060]